MVRRKHLTALLLWGYVILPVDAASLPAPIKRELYLVGIGNVAAPDIAELAESLSSKIGVKIVQLPPRGLDNGCYSADRAQYESRCLIDRVAASFPELVARHRAAIIAVTRHDIYVADKPWIFTFSCRDPRGIAVISGMRMAISGNSLLPPGSDLEMGRLRKLILKSIGILYFGMPEKTDPQSVLYDKIFGLEELDEIQERF